MKKIFFLVIILIANAGYSQSAYKDARLLRDSFVTVNAGKFVFKKTDTSVKKIAIILKNHLSDKEKNDTAGADAVFNAFAGNPFIGIQAAKLVGGSGSTGGLKAGDILKSAGNLDVTNLADGLAKFLIKRGKEELNIAFFQRMKSFLDSTEEAKTLFPNTTEFLENIASYRYAEFLQAMRESFYKDISNLVVNLNLLIDLPKYQKILQALPEIRLAVRSAKIVSELSQGGSESIHPANIIHELATLQEWGEINVNLKSSWLVLDRISESVRADSTDSTRAWISFGDFHQHILNDKVTLNIFMGLLYQRMDGITFKTSATDTVSVQTFMTDNRDNILMISDLVENFIVLANDVQLSIRDIKAKKATGLANEDYYTYINKAINVIEYGFKVAEIIKPKINADRYIVMARNANNLYKNIYTKSYNAAVMNASLIINEILTKGSEGLAEKKMLIRNNVGVNAIDSLSFVRADSAVNKDTLQKNEANGSKIVEKILRYGNLIASIVKAENSDEASAAIEAAVLPAGSSSIKKNTAWNISLNAYIGGVFGKNLKGTDIEGDNSKVGVTAPVGIAVSKGLGTYKNGSSIGALSLYGTLIDVGAVAGYRLNNDSTALQSKITLNDIFTPGGYLVYGVGLPFKWASYIPLSVGYGWQYGSKLYYKKADGALDISPKSRWRSNWFVAIDIPLANILSVNYQKK